MANQYILKKIEINQSTINYELTIPIRNNRQYAIKMEALTPKSLIHALRINRIFIWEPIYIMDMSGQTNLNKWENLPREFKILYDKRDIHIVNPYSNAPNLNGDRSTGTKKCGLFSFICCKKKN
jgi:hypothetical protein